MQNMSTSLRQSYKVLYTAYDTCIQPYTTKYCMGNQGPRRLFFFFE
jgi:hypothetical protein